MGLDYSVAPMEVEWLTLGAGEPTRVSVLHHLEWSPQPWRKRVEPVVGDARVRRGVLLPAPDLETLIEWSGATVRPPSAPVGPARSPSRIPGSQELWLR